MKDEIIGLQTQGTGGLEGALVDVSGLVSGHSVPAVEVKEAELLSEEKDDAGGEISGDLTKQEYRMMLEEKEEEIYRLQARLEEELASLQDKYETALHFMGGYSHNVNNFLCAIIGNSQLLKMKLAKDNIGSGEEEKDHIDEISKAVLRAKDQTQTIIDFSKGDLNRRKEPFNVCDAVKISLKFADYFKIEPDYSDENRAHMVYGNIQDLTHALLNLVKNSSEAGDESPKIKVERVNREDASFICVSVEDRGEGISDGTLEKILSGEIYSTKGSNGNGFGLGEARKLVEKAYGGKFEIYTQKGEGTKIKMYLPEFSY